MTNASIYLSVLLCCLTSFELFSQSESNKSVKIQDIQISGNKRTKEYIILREIQFNKGDTINEDDFKEKLIKSTQNIQNTSLFNFVEIMVDTIASGVLNIKVNVVERWYIWPYVMFKTAENNLNLWWIDKDYRHVTLMLNVVDLNFRGAREQLLLKTHFGYDNSINITYSLPNVNKNKTLGVMFEGYWSRNKEVNIGITDFKNQFYRMSNSILFEGYGAGIGFVYRPAYRVTEQVSLSYNGINFNDSVFTKNMFFAPHNKMQFFSIFSKLKIDYRDNKSYPLNGFYSDLILTQSGLQILSSEKFYKSSVQSNLRFYHSFNDFFHYITGINAYASSRNSDCEFLGTNIGDYGNEVRGYEYYKIPIQHFLILKNNLGFTLSKKKTKRIPFIKSDNIGLIHYAIYLNTFFDAALFWEDTQRYKFLNLSKPADKLIYSGGVGLDFVTYYDMVFRFEMSHNFLFNKWGFFVNLKASI